MGCLRLQGSGVTFLYLGYLFSRIAWRCARTLHWPVVVHGSICRWAAPINGRLLGRPGVGSIRGITPPRRPFSRHENLLSPRLHHLLHLRRQFHGSSASRLHPVDCHLRWTPALASAGLRCSLLSV